MSANYSAAQDNTDHFILKSVRERIHFLFGVITDQRPSSDTVKIVTKYYSLKASELKDPVKTLGRKELLISDPKQIKQLHDMFQSPNFNPFNHMNNDANDIAGHLVFSLNNNLYDSILDESFDNVNYWGTNTLPSAKQQLVLIMLLYDALFLTSFYEYGPKGLAAVLEGRLANTGQWWAWMELQGFSSNSYRHAGNLLHNTKSSSLDASINGASALFPTNMTYARFSGFIKNSHKSLAAYNVLLNKFSDAGTNEFNLVITPGNLQLFSRILTNFRFHAVAVYAARIHMFNNTYVGYLNHWRYNNSRIRSMVK